MFWAAVLWTTVDHNRDDRNASPLDGAAGSRVLQGVVFYTRAICAVVGIRGHQPQVYIVGAAGAAGSFICHKVSPFVGFSGFGKTCGSKPVHHQPFGVDGYDLKAERSFTRGSEHKNPAFFKGPGAVYKLPLVGGPRSDDVQGAALFEPVS